MCSVLYNLLYQFSQFPVSMENFKIKKMEELLSMDHHRALREGTGGPLVEPCVLLQIANSVQSVSICYLNANVSTRVFRSSSVIMCNWRGVSGENLVTQARWKK